MTRHSPSPPYRVGLTGGIGSGKSTVAALFAQHGVPVLDADLIGHELVAPGQACQQQIVDAFGPTILQPDGQLDRAALRQRVFSDQAARKHLEGILHPAILAAMRARAAASKAPYVLFVIPLLFEVGQQDEVDRVLVVDVPEALQRTRVKARGGLGDDEIDRILATQWARQARLAAANDVILNHGTLTDLAPQVDALHTRYMDLARRAFN